MEYTILVLLFYCSLQVFADAVDGTQTLDCDTTVQKQHRLLLQYSQAHLTTVRSAIRKINDSLQGLTQREQDLKVEADKSRELATLLQDVLSKMKNNGADGADENRIFDEKLEKEIRDLKSRFLQLDFKLSSLKIEDQTYKLQLKQMQTQEKDLEISISQQEQIGPLENIEIYLVAQLERSHETLELERQCCQFKLDATTKLMESNSKLVKSELKQVESKNFQIWNNKVAEKSIAIKNISEQLNNCIKEKTNLSSENRNLEKLTSDQNKTITEMSEKIKNDADALSMELRKKEFQNQNLTEIIIHKQEELNNYINARGENNTTPLIRAVMNNQASTVKALIDLGANLDLQNTDNDTALTWAAWKSNTEIYKMLLDAGADVNIINKWGTSALMFAAEKNKIEMVKMLLSKGAQVNLAEYLNGGYTALHWAAMHGHVEIAKLLVGHGANINIKINDGRTPLNLALYYNRTEMANYLKSVGATV